LEKDARESRHASVVTQLERYVEPGLTDFLHLDSVTLVHFFIAK
jgi:hypothetical protein